ncbi:Gfo/Idh/MocA family protein [Bacillus sp. J14TS2]|uniref:Gfo/Idh/MocA family protein n=1 Tax=Bacillus sp. J14TS2 TaxID=2807188 RepID=UPI001BB3E1FB|nr:Gfo/Idh/MocA family oxidoreductase [Bacillus sp. J14TS2]
MKKIKVGIIGSGFSALAHVEALRRLPDIEVVAISSRNKEKVDKIAAEFHIRQAYADPHELIHDPHVEVVHNCTPNHLHYEFNRDTLLAGKHLLSEKPLGMNSKQTKELVELSNKSPVVSGVCFNYRHFPLVRQLRDEIHSNKHGGVYHVHGGYLQDWCLYDTDYSWRMEQEKNGPSRAMADIGSHWCDITQYILGKRIVEVLADLKTVHNVRKKTKNQVSTFEKGDMFETQDVPINTEDYGSVLIRFEDGVQGVFMVSQVAAGRKNHLFLEIATEHLSFSWKQEEPNKLWLGKRNRANQELVRDPNLLSVEASQLTHVPAGHQEGWPDGLKNLMIDFYGTIKGEVKNPSFATFQDGHQIVLLIEAILRSHRNKQWVKVDNKRMDSEILLGELH